MTDNPGKGRRTADFMGITDSKENQRRRPVGSTRWWIYLAMPALLMVAITTVLRVVLL
jgi:hypothetical protein